MGARGRKRARSMERRAHERQGRLATEIALTSRQAILACSRQKRIAARGMPAAVRTRSIFDSSMAAEKPWSLRRAAAVSCSSADNPRKYIYRTQRRYGLLARPKERPWVRTPRSPIRIRRGWLTQTRQRTFNASSREYWLRDRLAGAFSESTRRL